MTSLGAGFALRGCPLELAALSPPSAAAVTVLSPDYPPTVLSAHCAVSRCACSSLTVLCPTSVLSLSHHGAACLTVLSRPGPDPLAVLSTTMLFPHTGNQYILCAYPSMLGYQSNK